MIKRGNRSPGQRGGPSVFTGRVRSVGRGLWIRARPDYFDRENRFGAENSYLPPDYCAYGTRRSIIIHRTGTERVQNATRTIGESRACTRVKKQTTKNNGEFFQTNWYLLSVVQCKRIYIIIRSYPLAEDSNYPVLLLLLLRACILLYIATTRTYTPRELNDPVLTSRIIFSRVNRPVT